MSKVQHGDTVKVHYTGTLEDGTVFDSSKDRDPLQFTLGKGQLIKGFEDAVMGMYVGETKTVTIPLDQAYGPRRDELMLKFEKAEIPQNIELSEGVVLHLENQQGRVIAAIITEVSENSVTLDANHPLAGEDLTFKIDLMEVA